MKKILLLLLLISVVAGSASAQEIKVDKAGIQKVIESFQKSMIERDKNLFLSLFLDGNITWQAVMEDASLSRIKVKRPQAIKARVNPENTHLAFIDGIVKDEKRNEEKFSNIKIITDGDAASVNFDYVFLWDGKEINRGKEMWLWVRTEEGWKITSVIYSMILPKPNKDGNKK